MLHRRAFMAGLGCATLVAPANAAVTAAHAGRLPLSRSYIVNMADQGMPQEASLRNGQMLSLRRQPERAFDSNSIAVIWRERQLGYLPANQSRLLAPLMDAGFDLQAVLVEVKRQPRPSAHVDLFLTSP